MGSVQGMGEGGQHPLRSFFSESPKGGAQSHACVILTPIKSPPSSSIKGNCLLCDRVEKAVTRDITTAKREWCKIFFSTLRKTRGKGSTDERGAQIERFRRYLGS